MKWSLRPWFGGRKTRGHERKGGEGGPEVGVVGRRLRPQVVLVVGDGPLLGRLWDPSQNKS